MKKKIVVIGIIISVLLIGIVSASLIDFFGKITGSVEVKGPVFYPDSHIAEKYHNLFINEIPNPEEIKLIDGENIIFVTESLGISDFYSAEYTIFLSAKTNIAENKLWAELWVLDENKEYEERICEVEFEIGATENFWTYEKSCNGVELNMDEEDRFALTLSGAGETSDYTIRVGDYSDQDKIMRIEVSAI